MLRSLIALFAPVLSLLLAACGDNPDVVTPFKEGAWVLEIESDKEEERDCELYISKEEGTVDLSASVIDCFILPELPLQGLAATNHVFLLSMRDTVTGTSFAFSGTYTADGRTVTGTYTRTKDAGGLRWTDREIPFTGSVRD